ncbi:MAG: hypothetical protein LJE85_07725 [Gammaproteobacteria bacterium]|nr:hypothetical protein [Gammaproteobacteria bacterium]
MKKVTALAKKPALVLPNDPKQLDFVFDKASDLKAWLRENGDFLLEGYIRHNHFRCGTYELGIQFGKGDGCVNVEWLTQPVYISRHRQCNQAVLHHDGAANVPELAGKFNEVTCGQLFIRCNGVCGMADIPTGSDPSSTGVLR